MCVVTFRCACVHLAYVRTSASAYTKGSSTELYLPHKSAAQKDEKIKTKDFTRIYGSLYFIFPGLPLPDLRERLPGHQT